MKTGSASMSLLTTLGGEPPIFLMAVLLGSLLILLSALVTWFIALLRRQHGNGNFPQPASIARWLAISVIVLHLSFLVVFVLTIMSNPVQLMFGFNSSIIPILLLPLFSIVLTVGLLVFTILAWKYNFWSTAGRIHYTLVTIASLGVLWALNSLHLLILP